MDPKDRTLELLLQLQEPVVFSLTNKKTPSQNCESKIVTTSAKFGLL